MIGGAEALPVLSAETLADCLLLAAIPDDGALYTDSDEWTPTYDYHRAAAAAWRRKAAIVAADYSVVIEGRDLQRGQMIDNFLKMANAEAALAQPRYFAAPDQIASWRV